MNRILIPERKAYVQFCAPIFDSSIRTLLQTINSELSRGTTHFTILISSSGGNVHWGLTAYNFLKGVPAPVQIDTHNMGSIDSIALVIYCAGKRRYSVPHARFLMRGVGHDLLQGTHLEEKALDELLKSLKMDTQNIACVISENTGKTEKEIMKAMYQGTVLNPEQAVTFGLVHEIKAELFPINTRVIAIS